MLIIKYKKINDVITNVNFIGHAEYDIKGKDIVCAASSSIYITTINAILSFDKTAITCENNNVVNVKKDNITNTLLNNMINELNELEKSYKKNIKIMEE